MNSNKSNRCYKRGHEEVDCLLPSEKSGSRLHDLQQPELSFWWRCALLGPWWEARQKEEGGILVGKRLYTKAWLWVGWKGRLVTKWLKAGTPAEF